MLRDWDKRYPGRIETMFSAMQNVVPSHLSDTSLFDFKSITHGSDVVDGGDLAFDREEIPMPSHEGIFLSLTHMRWRIVNGTRIRRWRVRDRLRRGDWVRNRYRIDGYRVTHCRHRQVMHNLFLLWLWIR